MTPSLPRLRAPRWLRDLASVGAFCAVALGARASLADHYRVPTGSMQPTVDPGDHIIVNKLAYGLRIPLTHRYVVPSQPPQRGDVVVLDSPEQDTVLLKRVVAVPGDTVEVRSGRVLIDGQRVPVAHLNGSLHEQLGRPHPVNLDDGGGPDLPPTRVPEGRYLLLGDNRGNSHDGRSFGLVDRATILGKATLLIRSPSHVERL